MAAGRDCDAERFADAADSAAATAPVATRAAGPAARDVAAVAAVPAVCAAPAAAAAAVAAREVSDSVAPVCKQGNIIYILLLRNAFQMYLHLMKRKHCNL